jgi:SsrA-binding protein
VTPPPPSAAAGARQGSGRGRPHTDPHKDPKRRGDRRIAQNRRARHDYDILETFECGISLHGGEVKSLRLGQVSLQDSYARVEYGEVWLLGVHIAPYEYATGFGRFDPDRPRKLLLHRAQIDEIAGRVGRQSLTLVPLSLYLKEGRVKVELALARGRRLYDKRHAIATREAERDSAREIKDVMSR